MRKKAGIVEGLERISKDWAKNFSRSWTQEELAESVAKFNKTKDLNSRHDLFYRFLNSRLRYVEIKGIGVSQTFQTDFVFEKRLPGNFMPGDTRKMKVGITGLSIVVLKKEFVRYGCKCTVPHLIWVENKKIPLSAIKEIKIQNDTLLVTLR